MPPNCESHLKCTVICTPSDLKLSTPITPLQTAKPQAYICSRQAPHLSYHFSHNQTSAEIISLPVFQICVCSVAFQVQVFIAMLGLSLCSIVLLCHSGKLWAFSPTTRPAGHYLVAVTHGRKQHC